MNKKTRRLIASGAVTAAAVTAGMVSHSITKRLVGVALDREVPKNTAKSRGKLSGTVDFRGQDKDFQRLKKELETTCESVSIESSDGKRLVGHWWKCENPKRIIIAMHGWRSSWANDFALIAPFWNEMGCSVLFAEQRGQNNSGGGYISFGLIERFDCYDWVNWVNITEGDSLPVYLGGISMGATTVLMTAGFDLPENVKGIIADCGFTAPVDIWRHVLENNLKLNYKLRKGAINKMYKRRLRVSADGYSAVEAMENCKVPVLFIHGTDDHFVPIDMTYENYKACRAKKRLFVVPGADHGMSYFIDKEGYEKELISFWEQCESKKEGIT